MSIIVVVFPFQHCPVDSCHVTNHILSNIEYTDYVCFTDMLTGLKHITTHRVLKHLQTYITQ